MCPADRVETSQLRTRPTGSHQLRTAQVVVSKEVKVVCSHVLSFRREDIHIVEDCFLVASGSGKKSAPYRYVVFENRENVRTAIHKYISNKGLRCSQSVLTVLTSSGLPSEPPRARLSPSPPRRPPGHTRRRSLPDAAQEAQEAHSGDRGRDRPAVVMMLSAMVDWEWSDGWMVRPPYYIGADGRPIHKWSGWSGMVRTMRPM
jgi:hypothetical protein